MKQLHRTYNMSDPELLLQCEDVLDSIDRDITEFTARGFTPTKRTEFENAIANFDALPSDNYLLGQQEIKTGEKNNKRTECETAVNVVLTAVVNIWGIDSTHYNFFTEDKSLSLLTDSDLLRYLEDIADAANDELAALAAEGIDATTVANLRTLRTDYNIALKNQRIAVKTRNTGEGTRVKTGNALYALLVKYCNTGKNIWINIDETKYNDYVITHTPPTHHSVTVNVVTQTPVLAAEINYHAARELAFSNNSTVVIEIQLSTDGINVNGPWQAITPNSDLLITEGTLAPTGNKVMARLQMPPAAPVNHLTLEWDD